MNRLLIFLFLAHTALAARISTWADGYGNISQIVYVNNTRLVMGACTDRWDEALNKQSLALPPAMKPNSSISMFSFYYDGSTIGLVYQSDTGSINLAIYECAGAQAYGPWDFHSLSRYTGIPDDDISPDTNLTVLYASTAKDYYPYEYDYRSEYDYNWDDVSGVLQVFYQDKHNMATKIVCFIGWDLDDNLVLSTRRGEQISPFHYQTPGLTGATSITPDNITVTLAVFQVNEQELFILHSSDGPGWDEAVYWDMIGWPTAIDTHLYFEGSEADIAATGLKINLQQSISDSLAIGMDPSGQTGVWIFFADTSGVIHAVTNVHSASVGNSSTIQWNKDVNFTTAGFDQLYTNLGQLDPYYGMAVSTDWVEGLMVLTWVQPDGELTWMTWSNPAELTDYIDVLHHNLTLTNGIPKDIPKEATKGKKTSTGAGLNTGVQAGIAVGVPLAISLLLVLGFWVFYPRKAAGRPRWVLRRPRGWKRLSG